MKPHSDSKLFETPISIHWLDKEGLVCSLPKEGERSLENMKLTMGIYSKLMKNGKKNCLLTLSSKVAPMNSDVRNYLATELPKYFNAMAIISERPLHATLANLFFRFSWKRIPVKLFSTEEEARAWLQEYLK